MRRAIVAICVCLLDFAGCQPAVDPGKPKQAAKGKIGISVLTMSNPFFKEIADTLADEAGKHGYEVIAVDGDNDVPRQQKQVKDFLVQGVRAIVLCPCDSKAIGAVIKEANMANVPVFTADIACLAEDAKVVSHIATDNYAGGKQAGEAMIEALGPNGGKVLLLDYQKVESCILRVKGFKEVLDAHNADAKTAGKIKIVMELPCDGKRDVGYKATEDALQAHPDIAGIFAINDPAALGARAALEKANKAADIKIIGFDGQPDGKKAIAEGKIYADPIQHPDQIGRETAKAIVRYFAGEPPQAQILIPTNLYRKADAEKDGTK